MALLIGLLVLAVLAVIVVLLIASAVVVIPILIVTGLAFAGYRAARTFAVRKTNELLNRDGAGRHNVRVLRSGPSERPPGA